MTENIQENETLIQLSTKKEQDTYRAKLIKEQGGKCAITGLSLRKPVLDHCHGSGRCRGIIENDLNRLIPERDAVRYGVKLKDLPTRLRQMADYLERSPTRYLHLSGAPKPKILTLKSYNQLSKARDKAILAGRKIPKLPKYRYAPPAKRRTKEKPYQKMTKPLIGLFELLDIEPVFYSR